jgi:hypothetical protein
MVCDGSRCCKPWEDVMTELEWGYTVMIEYHDAKERASVARSPGRQAAHRGFKVDQRNGDGSISARMIEPEVSKPAGGRKARGGK